MDLLTMRKSGRLHRAEEPEEDIMSADLYKRRRAFAGAAFSHAFILSAVIFVYLSFFWILRPFIIVIFTIIPALFLVPCVCLALSKKFKCYFNPIWLLFTTILIYALSFFAVLVYIMIFRHIPPNKFFYYELEMEWLWSVYGYPTWVYVAGLTIRAFNRRKSAQLRIANSDQVDGADLKKSST